MNFDEAAISTAIIRGYHEKLRHSVVSDVIVVGAGPSGLVAAADLATSLLRVTLIESRLTTGGGIWGGAMGMNEVVLQAEALPLLEEAGVRTRRLSAHLLRVDAVELAAALTVRASRSGVTVLNMLTVEDLALHEGQVTGVAVNRSGLVGSLPIDPLTLRARVVIDATGHDASLVRMLSRRGLLPGDIANAEGPMNAPEGERFVVDRSGEVFPGLYLCGMAVCATWGGPRMGPIFGGMLLSGRRCAAQIASALRHRPPEAPAAASASSTPVTVPVL
ncbi:MAG: sulfide-dependent adenosine diphosphate thiazole synthase [Phycisphaerales bacterium JB038]